MSDMSKVTYDKPQRWYFIRGSVFSFRFNIESALFVGHNDALLFRRSSAIPRKSHWREWFPSEEEALADFISRIEDNIKAHEQGIEKMKRTLAAAKKGKAES